MASLRDVAQNVIHEAREGIAWIALWKEGRGWKSAAFWPDYNEKTDLLTFDTDDIPEILEIIEKDPNAIIVNSWVHNLGPVEEATRDTLADALRWQYELQHARLADYLEDETSYIVIAVAGEYIGGEYVGKTPIREQAVNAAKTKTSAGGAVDVVQFKNTGGAPRLRRVRYLPDGSVRKLWEEARKGERT